MEQQVEVTTVSTEEKKILPYIVTFSGVKFYFNDVKSEMINIKDIAHSLSNMCRFNGHTKEFYSVAQHSVLVSDSLLTLEERRAGLLHDATEAYMGDLPSPFKISVDLGQYSELERTIHAVINERYEVNGGMTPNIKKADLEALFTEKRDLLLVDTDWGWGDDIKRFEETIVPLSPKDAEILFLSRFIELFVE